jgi:nucleoside phosphorylase
MRRMSVPNDPTKHGRPSLVTPELLAEHGAASGAYATVPPPRAAILCYHRGLAQRLLADRPHLKVPGFFADTYLLDDTDRTVALVADFGIGAPVASVVLEDLIALGCTRIVSIGTCGGMRPGIRVGDLVLCTGAVRDEGTSHHYLPAGAPALPHPGLTAALASQLEQAGAPHERTRTWTTDAPYRETAEEVDRHVADGVAVVEMEAAALFVVGEVRGAQVASALVVSDVLDVAAGSAGEGDGWEPAFHGASVAERLDLLFEVALATLR